MPIEISTYAELRAIAELLGGDYVQVNDIDAAPNIESESIVDGTFSGSFDGGDFEIQNYHIDGDGFSGLFRGANGAHIENVIIKGATITNAGTRTGFIVGRGLSSGSTIYNCTVNDSVLDGAGEGCGGIFGFTTPDGLEIVGCHINNSTIKNADQMCGGVVGYVNGTAKIKDCRAHNVTVESTGNFVGGIAGQISEDADIEGCVVESSNLTGGQGTGGILGDNRSDETLINGCHVVSSDIETSDSGIGGVVGRVSFGIMVTVRACVVENVELRGGNEAGGVVGYFTSPITIEECSIKGGANEAAISAGGIAGRGRFGDSHATIRDTYSSISMPNAGSTFSTAGLVGRVEGDLILERCYSTVAISQDLDALVATVAGSTNASDNFCDTDVGPDTTLDGGTGKTTSQMHDLSTYTDTATEGLSTPWDMVVASAHDGARETAVWWIEDGQEYPQLWYIEQAGEDAEILVPVAGTYLVALPPLIVIERIFSARRVVQGKYRPEATVAGKHRTSAQLRGILLSSITLGKG